MGRGIVCLALLPCFASGQALPPDQARLISLARRSVEAAVRGEAPPKGNSSTPAQPVFVTIEIHGVVRGCRGSLVARSRSLEQEVVLAATGAAAHDPRYSPIRPGELKDFLVTVTVVDRQEPIDRVDGLAPGEGLALISGNRTGIVLPWEGRDPQVRLRWAYRKAGTPEGAAARLFRLFATRFRG